MQPMGLFVAIRDYINKDGGQQVPLDELKAFKDACSEQDRQEFRKELESYGYTLKD